MTTTMDQAQRLFLEGSALLLKGSSADALDCFEQLNKIIPSNPVVLLHAGTALHNLGRYEEAVACYQAAIRLAPHIGELHNNLGNSLLALGRFADAVASFTLAAPLIPSSPVPLSASATALQAQGLITEAETACRTALIIAPDFAQAHWNLALNLLLQGRYHDGWQEYEWRWQRPDFTSPCRHTDIPLWDGSPLHGQTILLHAEQGFGDAIQFVRYAPLVAQRGGSVVLECHSQLFSLFRTIEGIQAVAPFGAPVHDISCQAPLLSLPHIFKTTLENIPSRAPYLSVPIEYRKKWATLPPNHHGKLRIGLVWAGKSYPDPLRSCRLSDFTPLADMENVTFFSLQIGEGAEQLANLQSGMKIIDLTNSINDFSDTAALIEQLDLIISIDTATAHLAGALGKPTWLLLPFAPDWRWLLARTDSPWYPSILIFRQEQPGEWGKVISRVHTALDSFLRSISKNPLRLPPKD